MTTLRETAQQALEWADHHGEIVFAGGGWKAVDGMNAWAQAFRAALSRQGCTYKVKEMDGFGTLWATECGEGLYVAAPEAIGFSLAPMPNADGKFCRFCGNKIILKDQK